MPNNLNIKKKINLLTIVIVYIFIFFLNYKCNYITDDWHFKFIWESFMPLPNTKHVQSFDDIIVSMQNYYNLSGGRVICHFFAYTMLYFDKQIFNFINALFFVTLGLLCYQHTKNETKDNIFILPLIYLLLLLFLPQFGNTCLWLSGSTNYLWPTVILLACFSAINRYSKIQSVSSFCLLYVLVTISSFTNEITAGMVIIFLLITFGIENKKLSIKLIPAFIFALIGMITVISAPGNFNRAYNVEKTSIFNFNALFSTFCIYLNYLIEHYYIFLFIIIFSIFLSIRSGKSLKEILVLNRYFITGFLGISALSCLGFLSEHPVFIGIVPILIATISNIYNILHHYQNNKQSIIQNIAFTFNTVSFVLIFLSALSYISRYTDFITTIYMLIFSGLILTASILIKRSSNIKQIETSIISIDICFKKIISHKKLLLCSLIIIMLTISIKNSFQYFKSMDYYTNYVNNAVDLIVDDKYKNIVYALPLKNEVGIFYPSEALKFGNYHIGWIAMNYDVYIEF